MRVGRGEGGRVQGPPSGCKVSLPSNPVSLQPTYKSMSNINDNEFLSHNLFSSLYDYDSFNSSVSFHCRVALQFFSNLPVPDHLHLCVIQPTAESHAAFNADEYWSMLKYWPQCIVFFVIVTVTSTNYHQILL